MKQTFLLLAGVFAAAVTSSAQVGTELIANGEYSQLDDKGWPVGWPSGNNARIEKAADGNRLVVDGAGSGVNFKIPLKPEYGRLKLTTKMKVTGVTLGKEGWQTGRLTMAYYNAAGERVGEWPAVFGMIGTTEWTDCERVYPVPPEAVTLALSPCNLGTSGTVEFRALSLTVCRVRALAKADAPLPANAEKDPWSLNDAWRQTTPTREKICLNGLWGFRPVQTNEAAVSVPAAGDCWGWFKIPGVWPDGAWEFDEGAQTVWLAPWLEEQGGVNAFEQAWYKRRISVPHAWQGRRVALDFTLLQTHVRAFVDGAACGELWYPGGELDLTGKLKPGAEQELALLVTARPLSAESNAFMAPDRVITDQASVKLKGITGDLFLYAMPAQARLVDAQVLTSVRDRTITFAVETAGLGTSPLRLRSEVTGCGEAGRVFASEALTPDEAGVLRFTAPWADAKLWDTDTPQNRYTASLTLMADAGEALDTLTPVSFGFREIRIAGRDFLLNGTPVHLRALYNGSANGKADKASVAAASELCRRMAEYGFNALIGGNYDFQPGSVGYLDGLLEACDTTGMLMAFSLPHVKDFGNALQDPAMAERYRTQTAWLIKRARNHPSVIFYAMNHNSTGYYGDQNPLKIDGVYEIPKVDPSKNAWWEHNRKQARISEAIAKAIDPTRPVYHHQSGNLGDMHTVNCYLNWAPIQERSDWTEHWATQGVKPLFFVEWGLPHISSWSSYRGPQFIWRCEAFQSLWAAEFAAQFWGDAAYRDDAAAVRALDHEEALWATGKPFHWSTLNQPLRALAQNYAAVQALFASDNWRSHRTWGVSAMLPWDQEGFWERVAKTPTVEVKDGLKSLKQPGIVPDRLLPGQQFIEDLAVSEAYEPTVMGRALLRWNMPDCAFIAGPAEAFTAKDHLFAPGAAVKKSLVALNDRRRAQTVRWTWRLWQKGDKLLEKRGSVEVPPGGKAVIPVAFALPKKAKDGADYRLTAVFEFEGGMTQVDELPLRAVKSPQPPKQVAQVLLYDPQGLTTALFDRLRVPYLRFDGSRAPGTNEVMVIGREALDGKAVSWLTNLPAGLRVLVFEQRAALLESGLGFRIAERGSRQLYPRFAHPVTQGFGEACFRDWPGSATLLPPHLEGLPEAETHDPLWTWCGFQNTRVWRCGSRGNVASVLIEKPAKGDWRALVDGEFDLQYAALLENVEGHGRVIFCQLDVTGRTESNPVSDRLVVNLLGYLDRAKPEYKRKTACFGSNVCEAFVQDLGVQTVSSADGEDLLPQNTLLVAGPGSFVPRGFAQRVEQGLNVLCMGMGGEELKAWSPVPVETARTNACFTRIEKLPKELNGLSNADWAWHGRMSFDALVVPESERESSSPALRVIRYGKGCVVLCQVPPWMIDEKAKPYLRTSKRHANAMAARLLANLGAGFSLRLYERLLVAEETEWLKSYYLDVPEAGDDPYRYYRW